jgi:3-oxoacyl-[acyl-carrier protein] reductase
VNNAGISRPQDLTEITEQDWDEVLAVNLKSMFLLTQAVQCGMRKRAWGRIINLSSVAAQTGGVIGPHYAASKAGAIGLTHSFAALLANHNDRFAAVMDKHLPHWQASRAVLNSEPLSHESWRY